MNIILIKLKIVNFLLILNTFVKYIWRPPSLSKLTPMIFESGLTHIGSDASIFFKLFLNRHFYNFHHFRSPFYLMILEVSK